MLDRSYLATLSISQASRDLAAGKYSAIDLAAAYLDRIKERDGEVHAYLEVFDDVLEQARSADARIQEGKGTSLTGIPFAVKDNILIEGRRAGGASKILEGYRATYDATAIKRLKEEGVVFIGRTNMDEFAMGGSTENSAYGVTRNPHDASRVPGGSSGGSAAAVAMKGALAALGSDTGGSIRQPASFCGVVGLKPTYGAVSRSGLMAMGSSLDQIGPITNTVTDAEIIFKTIAGTDPLDSTTRIPEDFAPHEMPAKLRVGVPRHFLERGVDAAVLENFEASLEKLRALGHSVEDIELPNIRHSLPVYYVLMPAEVSANLARYDGVRYGARREGETILADYAKTRGEGFGPEVRRRILLGTYVLSAGYYDAYYGKALRVRDLIRADFAKAFVGVDLIALPTAPTPAFRIGEKSDPLSMYLEDIFTTPANIAGLPAISLPSGTTNVEGKDLPLGLELMAAPMREDLLFRAGKEFLGEGE
ncbi:MAG TPA: Asp-tRNA(Asn)/Glu-tRNA(Gln) amidotransferase subunit GatA [Candidatus Paceibacterota bacterium]|nr:Asp-tRNA(Asn)/Glu-tRNA(Gln) amidotransferase subunit GatA [Candidatus Paceibacterota bacterium]